MLADLGVKGKVLAAFGALLLGLTSQTFAEESSAADPESLGFSTTRLTRIQSWYQSRVEHGDLSGAVLAISRNGKLAYLQAIGYQDHDQTVPMRTDSIFWISSMTKPVTCVAAMILAQEGKLELDAPVPRYPPEFSNAKVANFDHSWTAGPEGYAPEAMKRPILVRDLLNDTAGFGDPANIDRPISKLYRENVAYSRDTSLADMIAGLSQLPLAHQPGEVWSAGWSADVLARVIEVASGQPFNAFLQSRIFGPLHMVDTNFYVFAGELDRLVDAPSVQRPPLWDVARSPQLYSGEAGLVSTALDYSRFLQMLLNDGELDGVRLLQPESVKTLTTNALAKDSAAFASASSGATGPMLGSGWGSGFAIRTEEDFSQIPGSIGSFGWRGLWGTFFWVDPTEKLIAVQMIQTPPGQEHPFIQAFRNLTYGALRVPEPAPFTTPATPLNVSATALAGFAGEYDFGASTSARDRQALSMGGFSGIGVAFATADDAVKIEKVIENGAAWREGIRAGDLIFSIDDESTKGLRIGEIAKKLTGPVNTKVRLKIRRIGQDQPIEIAVARRQATGPEGIKLRVQVEGNSLAIESTGAWPILDFERKNPVLATALSDQVFFIDAQDHTRIAFIKDANGDVVGATLNPGPFEQKGARIVSPRAAISQVAEARAAAEYFSLCGDIESCWVASRRFNGGLRIGPPVLQRMQPL